MATYAEGTAVPVGGFGITSAIAPDGKTAYVMWMTDVEAGRVTPVTLATGRAGTPIAVGNLPSAIAITPDGKTGCVANELDGTVTPITIATNTRGQAISVGGAPVAIAITPDDKRIDIRDRQTEPHDHGLLPNRRGGQEQQPLAPQSRQLPNPPLERL